MGKKGYEKEKKGADEEDTLTGNKLSVISSLLLLLFIFSWLSSATGLSFLYFVVMAWLYV